MKSKDPTNYLLKDIPDFHTILHLYKQLYLQTPTIPQMKEIQLLRNKNGVHTGTKT